MRFYSNGKLLITGEYFVLNGALSLALPTIYGQYFEINYNNSNIINWTSYNNNRKIWFNCQIEKDSLKVKYSSSKEISRIIKELINFIRDKESNFLKSNGSTINTELTFDKDWGLGSSSTLINNLSKFSGIDPYELNTKFFNGSGYDIACANSNTSLVYRLNDDKKEIKKINFNPSFRDKLHFVYLNKKQNSLDEIKSFRESINSKIGVTEISEITERIILCKDQLEFNSLIKEHEDIVSKLISKEKIKDKLFDDFNGEIKSLGAWGGDFILASAIDKNPIDYFRSKGFHTIFNYNELALV
ncbi:MAG: GYDIA family GHMP kinase [Bacteroidetes bacterium]|nr:GYDIA family GHMP kinase [Bacteroidota bacterium]MDA0885141.1 GYDIA family GHMP kinase [Bacteroidota bacterium]MDA1225280.1 GYDIA family GHMP kinase [Bacteroidota bacterium]